MESYKGMKLSLMLKFLTLFLLVVTVFSQNDCGGGDWQRDSGGGAGTGNCDLSNGEYTMTCGNPNDPSSCGLRLSSVTPVGFGSFSATIKSAPGPGMNTAWYLYQFGRNNDQSQPWCEIDIEILGNQCGNSGTQVWTNFITNYNSIGQYAQVGWDCSADYHNYTISVHDYQVDWLFDGNLLRTQQFDDAMNTCFTQTDMQAEMSLWGQDGYNWPDMGSMTDNTNQFPLYGYYTNVNITTGNGVIVDMKKDNFPGNKHTSRLRRLYSQKILPNKFYN